MSRGSKQAVVHVGTHKGVRYSLVEGSDLGA